jgi:hypothetical protein
MFFGSTDADLAVSKIGFGGFAQCKGNIRAMMFAFIRALITVSAETSIEARAHIRADLRDLSVPSS